MQASERAAQIWSVLALAATHRQILTYDLVAQLTGVARQGLGHILERIQSYCLVKGLPPLTALVVRKDSGLPSFGFTGAADVPSAQAQVFGFDWLRHGCPDPDELEAAKQQRPSKGEKPAEARPTGAA
jgi:hypothetical protein